MKPQPTITLIPRPPRQGAMVTLCYVGGVLPRILKFDWMPAGLEPHEVECPEVGGCLKVRMPQNAVAVVISDPTGAARSLSTSVLPADPR